MKIRLVVPAIILLAGCATVGIKIDQASIEGLKTGITTKKECIERFGQPRVVSEQGDGTSGLVWSYAKASAFGVIESQSVHLIFDKNGVLISKTFTTTDPPRK